MDRTAVCALPGNESFADRVAASAGAAVVPLALHRFPDGESLARLEGDVAGRDVLVVSTLDRPDAKFLATVLAAGAARDHGAVRVVLVAPYLPYLRCDAVFAPGQGVSARHFGRLVSAAFDGVVTVDPHLHRLRSLDEVLAVPSRIARSAPALAAWVTSHVERPVLVGPDQESEQWVADVARHGGFPFTVLTKVRHGDRSVEVTAPELDPAGGRTPVLVDDIVSTGTTMAGAVRGLVRGGHPAPRCLGVHAVFADDAGALLRSAGAEGIRTTDTIPHPTNEIGVAAEVGAAADELLLALRRGRT